LHFPGFSSRTPFPSRGGGEARQSAMCNEMERFKLYIKHMHIDIYIDFNI